jgi:hypothetical protein
MKDLIHTAMGTLGFGAYTIALVAVAAFILALTSTGTAATDSDVLMANAPMSAPIADEAVMLAVVD